MPGNEFPKDTKASLNKPDERLVYLALRGVFLGPDAHLRYQKKVRDRVQKYKDDSEIKALLQQHSEDSICSIAKLLLERQVFESSLKAKLCFPEVFDVSPAQSAKREASIAEAAKSEADAIRNVAEGRPVLDIAPIRSFTGEEKKKGRRNDFGFLGLCIRTVDDRLADRWDDIVHGGQNTVPSLYPAYLAFPSQHRIMTEIQALLERSCFAYGQTTFWEELKRRGWDCPESAELNAWTPVLLERQANVNPELVAQRGRPLSEILNSLSHLRHTAVHRIRVTADRVYQFICDAENLSIILGDCESSERLADLRRGLESTIDDINRNKDLLESRHVEILKHLAEERAKLLRQEEAAHEHLLSEDKKYQARVTAILESNWKSANAVAGDNLEELDSNAGDGLSQDEVYGGSSRSDSRLGMITREADKKAF
jgi:hypothetical protein